MKIISRKEAKALHLATYFTGKPCKSGHLSEKKTSNGSCLECAVVYRQKNRSKINAANSQYQKKNKEKVNEKTKRWRAENPEKTKRLRRESMKRWSEDKLSEKIKNDPQFRCARNFRTMIYLYIKGVSNSQKASGLIGCDRDFFCKHIEEKFQEGMDWDNWGVHGWHMDHITPLSSFNLLNEDEVKKAFHYSNVQPLWASENIRKSNHDIRCNNGEV